MSGRPNPIGVRALKENLQDYVSTRERIQQLKQSIAESQKALELREAELRGTLALIHAKMQEMDVSSPGNAGWEARHFEMLLMMAEGQ